MATRTQSVWPFFTHANEVCYQTRTGLLTRATLVSNLTDKLMALILVPYSAWFFTNFSYTTIDILSTRSWVRYFASSTFWSSLNVGTDTKRPVVDRVSTSTRTGHESSKLGYETSFRTKRLKVLRERKYITGNHVFESQSSAFTQHIIKLYCPLRYKKWKPIFFFRYLHASSVLLESVRTCWR